MLAVGRLDGPLVDLLGPLGALLVFAAWWCFLLWFVGGRLLGWRRTARQYPAGPRPPGTRFRWRSMEVFPFGGYSNCLNVVVCDAGVWVRPMWLFCSGHPPILFPWSAVGEPQERSRFGQKLLRVPLQRDGRTWILSLPVAAFDSRRGAAAA